MAFRNAKNGENSLAGLLCIECVYRDLQLHVETAQHFTLELPFTWMIIQYRTRKAVTPLPRDRLGHTLTCISNLLNKEKGLQTCSEVLSHASMEKTL